MARKKANERYTVDEMFAFIENDGLGHLIQAGISSDRVPVELEEAWERARQAMDEISGYFNEEELS